MAATYSFDVTTGCDLQEVDNAVNQAQKEVTQRFDFKGALVEIEFKRAEKVIRLATDSDMRMEALFDVLRGKLIKRGVPVKNLDIGDMRDETTIFMATDDKVWFRTLTEEELRTRVSALAGAHADRVIETYRRLYPGASPAERLVATTT